MKTIRTGTAGKLSLRVVQTDTDYVGLVSNGSEIVFRFAGCDPDEAWKEVHGYLAKLGPAWFGFDGAKNRFLHWFAGGFNSTAYLESERAYQELEQAPSMSLCPPRRQGTAHRRTLLKTAQI
jgi:hypothetical protein